MKHLFFAYLLIVSLLGQAQAPDGIRLVEYNSSLYPIYGLSMNRDGSKLLVSAYGGRFYMLEIGAETGRGAFSQKEKQVWSKFLNNDFKWGAKPKFSPSGNSVLLKPLYDNPNVVKIKPTSMVVLDANDGSVILERKDVLCADYLDDNTLIVSTDVGLEWVNLKTKATTKKMEMPEVESLAISEDGKYIALSFVPTATQFVVLQSIQFRKRELKVAKRGKRLLAVYELGTMTPISIVDDEIDVVFRIKYSKDDKSLVLFTRNFKSRRGNTKKDLRQENASKLLSLNLIKVDIETGEIDRDFYYSSTYIHMDYDISSDGNLFAFSSTGMVAGSMYKTINGLEIYDYRVADKLLYSIKTRFKWFKRYIGPYQFAFVPGQTKCYISSGADLAEWDYAKLPNHVFNVTGNADEDVAATAITQLDSLCALPKFKEMIAKNKIQGMFVYDVTVFKKGQVATVFSPTDEVMDIKAHNILLDYLRTTKFEDLNIPKDKRVKFQYIFNLDNSESNP